MSTPPLPEHTAEQTPAEPQGPDPRTDAFRKARAMVVWTVAVVLIAIVAVVVFAPPAFMEFRLSVLIKLGVGVVATVVLAALLMAASFYSNRTGHDDEPSSH
jgi:preprotein translocase subunit SecF